MDLFTRDQKLEWGKGPWVDEEDMVQYEDRGILCLIKRHPYLGVFRGYIFVPKSNKYAQNEEWRNLDVHGGVSFCSEESIDDSINLGDTICIGFDCGHWLDYWPATVSLLKKVPNGPSTHWEDTTYKDISFVKEELKKMIDQVLEK